MTRILVIDDETELRGVLANTLRHHDFEVLEAASAEDGLHRLREVAPDLILTDICMEGIDGFRLVSRLKEDPATAVVPVILMTGQPDLASLGEVRRGMELGADDFLLKPFASETLVAAVNARLTRHQVLQRASDEARRRFTAILEATPDLVIMADKNGRILSMNEAARAFLALSPEEAGRRGLTLGDIHSGPDVQRLQEECIPTACLEDLWRGEATMCGSNGRIKIVSEILLAHQDREGEPEFLSLIAHDITERKQAELDRQRMEVQLRLAQKLEAIGQLAAGIAHEINTPTQYIGDNTRFFRDAFADILALLEDYDRLKKLAHEVPELANRFADIGCKTRDVDMEYLRDEIPRALDQTLQGVEHVRRIVQAMKVFSHPGTETKTNVDLRKAIESTVTVARNEWKYVADLITEFEPDLPSVPCLPGEINQVFLNLIVNAAHAIAEIVEDGGQGKGRITISARKDGDFVEVRIADTGAGIPQAIHSRVFDPFFTTKEPGKGTGQGLAIAHAVVVEKHGGTLRFESRAGNGTTFVIRLPLQASATLKGGKA